MSDRQQWRHIGGVFDTIGDDDDDDFDNCRKISSSSCIFFWPNREI